jgi:hypothetical protein
VAKLADALDLGSSAARHVGSTPIIRTKGLSIESPFFIFEKVRCSHLFIGGIVATFQVSEKCINLIFFRRYEFLKIILLSTVFKGTTFDYLQVL